MRLKKVKKKKTTPKYMNINSTHLKLVFSILLIYFNVLKFSVKYIEEKLWLANQAMQLLSLSDFYGD